MWCLITWTTYGYWLPGDPRGFRTRGHKKHVPPPERYASEEITYDARKFERLFESMKRQTGEAVELSSNNAHTVFKILKNTIQPVIEKPSIVSIGKHHVHILAELTRSGIPEFCKLAKGRSTMALRKLSFRKMKWARGYHTRFIETDEEARTAWRYISKHKHQNHLVERIDPA